jgi:hypothetical protein
MAGTSAVWTKASDAAEGPCTAAAVPGSETEVCGANRRCQARASDAI